RAAPGGSAGGGVPDPIIKTYAAQAAQHLERAGSGLAARQQKPGGGAGGHAADGQGNVPPWRGSTDLDFHGTLAAIWIWGRHQQLTGDARFEPARTAAWAFVERVWRRFIPEAIGPDAGDEAAYDCALVLRAALADRGLGGGALGGAGGGSVPV